MEKNFFTKTFFDSIDSLNEDDKNKLLEITSFKRVPSNTQLLKIGDHSTEIGLVIEGIVRVYNEDDKTMMFVSEGQAYGAKESIILNQKSNFNFETIDDSLIFSVDHIELENTVFTHPNIASMLLNYWKTTAYTMFQNYCNFILYSPEQRYEHLIETQPNLILKVKSKHLASFLGIHPVSLSRLKNRYYKNGDHSN